jgi:DNA-binding phage protein
MKYANDIKTLLHSMVHRSKKSVAQLADETGISTNYLYRACNPLFDQVVQRLLAV